MWDNSLSLLICRPLHCAILYDMKDLLKQMFTVLGKGQHRPIINDRNLKDEVRISLPIGKSTFWIWKYCYCYKTFEFVSLNVLVRYHIFLQNVKYQNKNEERIEAVRVIKDHTMKSCREMEVKQHVFLICYYLEKSFMLHPLQLQEKVLSTQWQEPQGHWRHSSEGAVYKFFTFW
jgi:hypothetical protein